MGDQIRKISEQKARHRQRDAWLCAIQEYPVRVGQVWRSIGGREITIEGFDFDDHFSARRIKGSKKFEAVCHRELVVMFQTTGSFIPVTHLLTGYSEWSQGVTDAEGNYTFEHHHERTWFLIKDPAVDLTTTVLIWL